MLLCKPHSTTHCLVQPSPQLGLVPFHFHASITLQFYRRALVQVTSVQPACKQLQPDKQMCIHSHIAASINFQGPSAYFPPKRAPDQSQRLQTNQTWPVKSASHAADPSPGAKSGRRCGTRSSTAQTGAGAPGHQQQVSLTAQQHADTISSFDSPPSPTLSRVRVPRLA